VVRKGTSSKINLLHRISFGTIVMWLRCKRYYQDVKLYFRKVG